jgi:hypothetical protein
MIVFIYKWLKNPVCFFAGPPIAYSNLWVNSVREKTTFNLKSHFGAFNTGVNEMYNNVNIYMYLIKCYIEFIFK